MGNQGVVASILILFSHLVNFTHKLRDSDPQIHLENFNLARKWFSAKMHRTVSSCPLNAWAKKDYDEVGSPAFNSLLCKEGAVGLGLAHNLAQLVLLSVK